MATVTHGGTLPDTSDKADFYAIIDNATVQSIVNADIAAGAAIVDTKLATITTASKVNVSAITGQLANANLAQITAAAKVSGAALTLLPNIPSGAGIIPVANIGSILGANVSRSAGTIYQAPSDGIVVGYLQNTDMNAQPYFTAVTDSNATPSTVVQRGEGVRDTFYTPAAQYTPICFPVRKDDYWQVTIAYHLSSSGGTIPALFFIPLGS